MDGNVGSYPTSVSLLVMCNLLLCLGEFSALHYTTRGLYDHSVKSAPKAHLPINWSSHWDLLGSCNLKFCLVSPLRSPGVRMNVFRKAQGAEARHTVVVGTACAGSAAGPWAHALTCPCLRPSPWIGVYDLRELLKALNELMNADACNSSSEVLATF